MPDFYSNDISPAAVNRSPGRILYAAMSVAHPAQINDVLSTSSYAAAPNWFDLGSTKGGVQVTFNNAEDTIDVDQINTDILALPNDVEMSVSTNLVETTMARFVMAWEGDTITTNAGALGGPEFNTGFGPFESYTQRRLAVATRNPLSNKLRMFYFRRTQRAPQESTAEFQKSGQQMQIPIRFKILPDTSISSVRSRYGLMFDQV